MRQSPLLLIGGTCGAARGFLVFYSTGALYVVSESPLSHCGALYYDPNPTAMSLLVVAAAVGCDTKAGTGAVIGGIGGAAVGGVIGSKSHARAGEGAAIGAGIGALGGALAGHSMDKSDDKKHDGSMGSP